MWRVSPGASFYIAVLALGLTWAAFVASSVRRFVVAGAVAQWYCAPAGMQPVGAVHAGLRNALGPQFGTISFAGAVLALIELARRAAREAQSRQSGAAAVVCCLLRCVLETLLSLLEFLTKYALMWSALSGEALVDSGRAVGALLGRHMVDASAVWWMPKTLVMFTSIAFAVLWGVLLYVGALAAMGAHRSGAALGLSFGGGALAGLVLHLLGALLLDGADAVFICFMHEHDTAAAAGGYVALPAGGFGGSAHTKDVHDVMMQLPYLQHLGQAAPAEAGTAGQGRHEAPAQQQGNLVEHPAGQVAYVPPAVMRSF